ncbi:MAG: ATP-dependent Clp protease proteolytic subunit [Pseudonocardia sp.]|jgi:ATP-dependent Clp protease protease subunit|nr:ATP-dependent Clp protease proteolytic subunit [Pseudonocardia sp.]MDT7614168.1 ATP-dependent Clp protease, protease subunit [Pseudonocardiales bacterium]
MPMPTGTRVTAAARPLGPAAGPTTPAAARPLYPRPLQRPAVPPAQPFPPAVGGTALQVPSSAPEVVTERLLDERIVLLGGEVDDAVAHRVTAQLLLLAAQDPHRDITLYINSPGGSMTAGMAIYDTMQLVTPDVATWAVGFAASMGQFLLSAGAPGKRHALPHARILLHQPSAGIGGGASDIAVRAGVYAQMKQEIAAITARHTGRSVETITADSDRDHWFTAEEARAYGLVDHVPQRRPKRDTVRAP